MAKDLPSIEMLRKILAYDPVTGVLTWRARTPDMFGAGNQSPDINCRAWNTRYADTPAGTLRDGRYLIVNIGGQLFLAHRLCWAIHHGAPPQADIDHVNGDGLDNRDVNLRDTTHKENRQNSRRYRTNKSGVSGVGWHARDKCWRAFIGHGVHLGSFKTFEEAVEARRKAEAEMNYHPNHGKR